MYTSMNGFQSDLLQYHLVFKNENWNNQKKKKTIKRNVRVQVVKKEEMSSLSISPPSPHK